MGLGPWSFTLELGRPDDFVWGVALTFLF